MQPVTLLLLPVAALILSAASSVSAAELEWNQERVGTLARNLIEPLNALMTDLESRPSVAGKEQARAVIMKDVESLRLRARELAQRVASGAGRTATVALFREVQTLQSQAMKHAHDYPAPFDMHAYIDRAQSTMIELARYYGESPDPGDGSQS